MSEGALDVADNNSAPNVALNLWHGAWPLAGVAIAVLVNAAWIGLLHIIGRACSHTTIARRVGRKEVSSAIERGDSTFSKRIDGIEQSVNELSCGGRRPRMRSRQPSIGW
jgi:hypothetical protein